MFTKHFHRENKFKNKNKIKKCFALALKWRTSFELKCMFFVVVFFYNPFEMQIMISNRNRLHQKYYKKNGS